MPEGIALAVLGPVAAQRDGVALALGPARGRRVLSALALRRGAAVTVDALADLVWGDEVPASAENLLQGYVSGLRKVLERDRRPRAQGEVLVLEAGGYALRVALDVDEVEGGLDAVARLLGPDRDATGLLPRPAPGSGEELVARLDEVLARWRGTPYVELGDAPEAVAERARLEQLRLLALEQRAGLEVGLGRAARVAADLEALCAAHPLRERLWALRALALAHAGRPADALQVVGTARSTLADELGVDPGPELAALQLALLRQEEVVAPRARPAPTPPPALPLVGRDAELAVLAEAAREAFAAPGPPRVVVVTGDPGAGKTRLVQALLEETDRAGALRLTARCPQDEGVPALWPWSKVLATAGAAVPAADPSAGEGSDAFRHRADGIDALLDAVGDRPAVVVLDDLQWADASTVRVLAVLAAGDRPARLLVVLTWRSAPAPPPRLLELAGTLGRYGARVVPLAGLPPQECARLVGQVRGTTPGPEATQRLRERTGGNPFFVLELARLAGEGEEVAGAAAGAGLSAVVDGRLASVPAEVGRVLQAAAVLGREVDVTTLADAAEMGDDEVVDRLEAAEAAGLVTEVGVDRFRFVHDLVREVARDAVSRSRAARVHARAAASLARRGVPGRESDLARHWLAAGPTHAAPAWRAARAAASAAGRVHAYDEAAEWLAAGLEALAGDPDALAEDRCDLLLERAEAMRRAGLGQALRPVVHEALALAEDLDDDERAATAATLPTRGALWLASPYDHVDRVVVAGLRRLLDRSAADDDPRRCRAMLSLASEMYYAAGHVEREALVDEAVAMARRLGDPRLLLAALLAGSTSVWRSARTPEQHALAAEAVRLAERLGDRAALAEALVVRAATANDLGWPDAVHVDAERARAAARPERLLLPQVVADGLQLGWAALRGDHVRLGALHEDLARLAAPMDLVQPRESLVAAELMRRLWSGREPDLHELVDLLRADENRTDAPTTAFVTALLGRVGRPAEAAAVLADRDLGIDRDDWMSPAVWALAAETALHLGDAALAARVYPPLLGLAGRPATAGSGIVVGPVDAFLAMAALAVGERTTARRHADEAERVATSWSAPPVQAWVRGVRERWAL